MWTAVRTILWKDIKIELRTKEAFSSSFVFSVLVLVIFNFALDLTSQSAQELAAGLLWIAFSFAGVLSLLVVAFPIAESAGSEGIVALLWRGTAALVPTIILSFPLLRATWAR